MVFDEPRKTRAQPTEHIVRAEVSLKAGDAADGAIAAAFAFRGACRGHDVGLGLSSYQEDC